MTDTHDFQYFEVGSFSHLFRNEVNDAKHTFLMAYPCTASWSHFPNTKKYIIQDGNVEEKKVGYDKIRQKEPWKNLAVLGDDLSGIVTDTPPETLVMYWKEHFGHRYENIVQLHHETYCHDINKRDDLEKIITLFPYDHIAPDKHAVDPDKHYYLLSKTALADMGVHYPHYKVFDFSEVGLDDVEVRYDFPYLIKASHGLSGEGTYIIRNEKDLEYCLSELKLYLELKLVDAVVVSDFVKNEVQNYCVQFYVNKSGDPTLIGATNQLVSAEGVHLGGFIHYHPDNMTKFHHKVAVLSRFLRKHGYFGVVGVDILEDRDGQLHMIDANIRVNGSTPLCLQRPTLLALGKEVAKYSTDYQMEGSLDEVLVALRAYLDRKDFIILSVGQNRDNPKILDIYGIVAGETVEEMQRLEQELESKGLKLVS